MPIYFSQCECGHGEDYYQTIEGRDDAPIHCGKQMQRIITAPSMVMDDIAPYRSMVTGEMITSRARHREHLRDHGMTEVGNETKYLNNRKVPALPSGVKEALIRATFDEYRKR